MLRQLAIEYATPPSILLLQEFIFCGDSLLNSIQDFDDSSLPGQRDFGNLQRRYSFL
jgi:hypothetical protein